jgi:nucleotide-binding universal stress UspA family protein
MYKNLLVATDGSNLSAKAVTHAIGLAKALGAKLTAFYASPEYETPIAVEGVAYNPMTRKEYAARCNKEADRILKPISLEAAAAGLDFNSAHEIVAAPWEGILAAAKRNKCDAIVMASHGRRGLSAFLVGSETQKVVTHTKLPVLVVR